MKANELMIGDWVDLSDEANETIPCKVVGIMPEELYEIQPNDTACDIVGYDMVRPIPLTAEILEKNGFIHSPNKWDLKNKDKFYPYEIHLEDEGHFLYCEIRIYNVFIQNKICDVHELQHALRLCGLNDLADNFKI